MFNATSGNCVTMKVPAEMFFPEGDGLSPKEFRQWEMDAKAICEGCPITFQCLQAALAENEYGVWGGTTKDERDLMRKGTRRKPLNVMRNPNRK